MTEVYRKITVDLSRRSGTRVVFARQNDIGCRNLLIKVTDDGAPYKIESNNAVSLVYKRPDEAAGAIDATVLEDGTVLVEIAQVILRCVGEVACSVSIFDGSGNKITSSDFYIDVTESYYSGENLDDDPEYDLLHSLFTKISGYQAAENLRADGEEERAAAEREREEAEEKRMAAELAREEAEKGRQAVRESFETEVEERLSAQDARISGRFGDVGSATLRSNGWVGLKQTLTVAGLGEDDLVVFYPETEADREYMGLYGVFIYPNSLGDHFTVSAKGMPMADISLRYYIIRGRLPEVEV